MNSKYVESDEVLVIQIAALKGGRHPGLLSGLPASTVGIYRKLIDTYRTI